MSFKLPELPYKPADMGKTFSAETFEFHWGKHHKTYVDNMNKLIDGTPNADKSLEALVAESSGPLFNNAGQSWNHTFYWYGMASKSPNVPADLKAGIEKSFGGVNDLKEAFTKEAMGVFGSGWAWLVADKNGALSLKQTSNAENPLRQGFKPLLTCDVWEHAYYIDFRNARAKYIEAFWNLINWDFVAKNFKEKATPSMTSLMR